MTRISVVNPNTMARISSNVVSDMEEDDALAGGEVGGEDCDFNCDNVEGLCVGEKVGRGRNILRRRVGWRVGCLEGWSVG